MHDRIPLEDRKRSDTGCVPKGWVGFPSVRWPDESATQATPSGQALELPHLTHTPLFLVCREKSYLEILYRPLGMVRLRWVVDQFFIEHDGIMHNNYRGFFLYGTSTYRAMLGNDNVSWNCGDGVCAE